MGILSNFPWLRGPRGLEIDQAVPLEVRPALPGERLGAIQLIATDSAGRTDQAQLSMLTQIAEAHPDDLGGPWVALQGTHLVSAVLPLLSPGKTALMFAPMADPSPFFERATKRLTDALCDRAADEGVCLAQSLVDSIQLEAQRLLEACGFTRLAELIYLQGSASRGLKEGIIPPHLEWRTYSPQNHDLFARAILESYQESMDCPGLNGMRDIEDILAGHRATGEFDPATWLVLVERSEVSALGPEPAGVLLLNRVPRAGVTELVYIGLSPPCRGNGLGDLLLRKALLVAAHQEDCPILSLAVDAANAPALKLYWRHGLRTITRRTAFFRNVAGQTLSPRK